MLDRTCVGDLVDTAAHEQIAGQRPRRRVLDHLVHLELVVAGTGLEEEVVRQVLDEVTRAEDVVAVPRPALRVLRQRPLAAGEEVMRIPDTLDAGERRLRRTAVDRGRTGEHVVDRGGDELDMAELLRRDRRQEVVERAGSLPTPEVEGLEGVVEPGRHLAKLAAEQLLNGLGTGRIGIGRRRKLDTEAIDTENHEILSSVIVCLSRSAHAAAARAPTGLSPTRPLGSPKDRWTGK